MHPALSVFPDQEKEMITSPPGLSPAERAHWVAWCKQHGDKFNQNLPRRYRQHA